MNSQGNTAQKNKPGKQWNKPLVATEVHDKSLTEIRQRHAWEYTGNTVTQKTVSMFDKFDLLLK